MKRFFLKKCSAIVTLILVLAASSVAAPVHAQDVTPVPVQTASNPSVQLTQTPSTPTNLVAPNSAASALSTAFTQEVTQEPLAAIAPTAGATVANGIFQSFAPLINGLAYLCFEISATVLGFIGLIFNWVVVVTVFDFALYFANSPGFLTAWGILRDVGNILLLFGFIFMGLSTILDIQSFSARKTLPGLLIFAVLLNFSLFGAEAVVDVANTLTASLYSQAGQSPVNSGACATGTSCTLNGIAGNILVASGVSSIWSTDAGTLQQMVNNNNGALILFLMSIFMMITIWVLLAGAIMLFVRAVVLVFLLVVSPIGIAAMALPPLQSVARGWWSKLLSEAFFAPAFLLMILVSLKIMNSFGTPNIPFGKAIAAPGQYFGVFFAFILVMAFMIGALIISRRIGATGAEHAINFSQRVTTFAPAWVGRQGVGYVSRRAGETYNSTIGQAKTSRFAVVRGLAKATDAIAGDAVTSAARAGQGVKLGLGRSYAEERKHQTERRHEVAEAGEKAHLQSEVKKGVRDATRDGASKEQIKEGEERAGRALQQMDIHSIEDTLKSVGSKEQAVIARLISSSKAEKVRDSKELTAAQKEKFMHDRFHKAMDAWKGAADALKDLKDPKDYDAYKKLFDEAKAESRKLTDTDQKMVSLYIPEEFARQLSIIDDPKYGGNGDSVVSGSTLDNMKKNEAYTPSQRELAKAATLSEQLNKAVKDGTADAIKGLMRNIGKDIGEASVETLTDKDVIDLMKPQHWRDIMAKNEIKKDDDRAKIVNFYRALPGSDARRPAFQAYLKKGQNAEYWGNDGVTGW